MDQFNALFQLILLFDWCKTDWKDEVDLAIDTTRFFEMRNFQDRNGTPSWPTMVIKNESETLFQS